MARLALAAALLLALAGRGEARVNATNAMAVFLITDCNECVADKNSIFCTEAESDSNFVANQTRRVTITDKKAMFRDAPADGAKYCWEGECTRRGCSRIPRCCGLAGGWPALRALTQPARARASLPPGARRHVRQAAQQPGDQHLGAGHHRARGHRDR